MNTPNGADKITRKLEPKFEKLGKALAGGHTPTIAKALYANSSIREEVIQKCMEGIALECSTLCKKSLPKKDVPSLFRKVPVEAMPTFEWKKCIDELEMYAPLLLKLVFHICRHRDNVNKQKKGDSHYPGVCMAIACILKERNREMCGIQSILSLMMFQSCSEKKVR